jgi:hypothetical protein
MSPAALAFLTIWERHLQRQSAERNRAIAEALNARTAAAAHTTAAPDGQADTPAPEAAGNAA